MNVSTTKVTTVGPQIREIKDLVKDLQLAAGDPGKQDWGRAVFLIGAGCSRLAGIRLAGEIAQQCIIDLANKYSAGHPSGRVTTCDPDEALKWLHEHEMVDKSWLSDKPVWGRLYGKIFEEHFKSDPQQRDIILREIADGREEINWAHLCLGELVNRGFIHTVLTTNFDQLVLQGIISTGLLPVVADGIEALTRVSPRPKKPQVVHLHGSMHTYSMLNSERALRETAQDLSLGGMLYGLLKDSSMLVVVGYAGGEEGVMKLLKESAKYFGNMVIYWAMYEDDPRSLSDDARELLSLGHNKFVIPKCDADDFIAQIMEGLGIGVPEWMKNPTETLMIRSRVFAQTVNQDIRIKIEAYQERIFRLHGHQSQPEDGDANPLSEVASLRLAGRHKEAFELLKTMNKEGDPTVVRMRAESAHEAGQSSSDPNLLRESVAAWERVLELIPVEDSAHRYEAQIGLGKALQLLADLDADGQEDSRLQYLDRAVAAYRAVLESEIRAKAPAEWGNVQNNLGIALQNLGELRNESVHLREAIEAHQSALTEFTRDKTPASWAETQSNLAGAFYLLGELSENDAILFKRAIAAYREALKEYTRDSSPSDWAETQSNLGGSLQTLGEATRDVLILREAAVAYGLALQFFREEGDAESARRVEEGLGQVQQSINQIERGLSK